MGLLRRQIDLDVAPVHDHAEALADDGHGHVVVEVEGPVVHGRRLVVERRVDDAQRRGDLGRHRLDGRGRNAEHVLGSQLVGQDEQLLRTGAAVVPEVVTLVENQHRVGLVLHVGQHEPDALVVGDDVTGGLGVTERTEDADVPLPQLVVLVLGEVLAQFQRPVVLQVVGADDEDVPGLQALGEADGRQRLALARLERQDVAVEMQLVLQHRPLGDELLLMVHQLDTVDVRQRLQRQWRHRLLVDLGHPRRLVDELGDAPVRVVVVVHTQIPEHVDQLDGEELGGVDIVDLHVAAADLLLLVELPGVGIVLVLEDVLELRLGVPLLDAVQQQVAVDAPDDDVAVLEDDLGEHLGRPGAQQLRAEQSVAPTTVLVGRSGVDGVAFGQTAENRLHGGEVLLSRQRKLVVEEREVLRRLDGIFVVLRHLDVRANGYGIGEFAHAVVHQRIDADLVVLSVLEWTPDGLFVVD